MKKVAQMDIVVFIVIIVNMKQSGPIPNTILPTVMVLLFLSIHTVQAQITADLIATHCQTDSGISRENFLPYGEELAKTLAQLSPEAIERVFGSDKTVSLATGADLNESSSLTEGADLNEALDLDNINFPFFSAAIPNESIDALGELAEFLVTNPNATIEIAGHASLNFGGAQDLSERRAENVKDYLVELGIDADRIESIGLGYTEPTDSGSRQESQRVDFTLINNN